LTALRSVLRTALERLEVLLDRAFPPSCNPLYHLGALGFFFYWIVAVSGIYLYVFFDTGITEAFGSVERLTHDQWYAGGVMRSLHRYASDAMVVVMVLHLVREFSLDRYRGARWFTWVTGVPILWLVVLSGITGYWLVWDTLAQYVAVVTTEWLDRLPIFGLSIARNFVSQATLDDRFFTLMIFLHIALPLILLLVLWIHLQRVSKPEINPARGLAVGMFLTMLVLSLVKPATSQGAADLEMVPAGLGLDWFYLGLYPLLESWPGSASWGMVLVVTLILVALPWLPPFRAAPAASVDLANCNGCTRCALDCPYEAIRMMKRSDGRPFEAEAVVDPDLCVHCGICAGACPTSMPFRRASALIPGIDLPELPMATLRERIDAAGAQLRAARRGDAPQVMLFGCHPGIDVTAFRSGSVGTVSLACIGQLPPSFIDYVLSRDLADGVTLTGCTEGECRHRFGIAWTEARLAGRRDPHLRKRVPRERLETVWVAPPETSRLDHALDAFLTRLGRLEAPKVERRTAVYGLLALGIGYCSSSPDLARFPADMALIRLSFAHGAERKEPCRRLSPEELQELPPNMRRPEACSRERRPVLVELELDGDLLYRASLEPTGLARDGPSRVYERFRVPAGRHQLTARLRDGRRAEGFDYERQVEVELRPRQSLAIDFRPETGGFIIR
jgi:ferredoxin/coenzyme F420-reducing hydrogenase delta subunit